ncbi:MAG TPA: cation:proton antiporter [Acidimicrobiales bacterium]|nr:cation:proton antiporter [Acidimicrobiales bacterium]
MVVAAAPAEVALVLTELGLVVLGLGLLARLADRLSLSPIPFYLVAGLVVGRGGLVTLDVSETVVAVGSEIGVVLLLLTLGLEYSSEELGANLRVGLPAGVLDVVANAAPGVLAGLALGWDGRAVVLLGGVTYISSSGVISKVLADLDRLGNRETPSVLSILVMEDLAMAVYLPVVAALLTGGSLLAGLPSVGIALATVALVLFAALRHGGVLSRALLSQSDEALLLGVLGTTLVVAGIAAQLQVSAAVGAFLVGIALGGAVQERASLLVGPLRDLFAAAFFLFFGLQIDPAELVPVAGVAVALALVTAGTKVLTGWWAAKRMGIARPGRLRAGTALIARGEFSIVIAGLGVSAGIEPALGAVAAAYVLVLAIAGPVAARYVPALVTEGVERSRPAPAGH